MSEGKDDTFCHYCGREARVGLGLQWDHVPALNCAIPEDHQHISKTLVRACSECNLLASDIPHLDYLERHYWLKSKYLGRYYQVSWATITGAVMASANNANEPRLKSKESVQTKPNEEQEILISDDIEISLNRFTSVMAEMLHILGKGVKLDDGAYASILKRQKKMGVKVPRHPTKYFGSDWETLNDYIQGKLNQKILADSNKSYLQRVIKGEVSSANNMDRYHSGQVKTSEKPSPAELKAVKTPRKASLDRRENTNNIENVLKNFKALRELDNKD